MRFFILEIVSPPSIVAIPPPNDTLFSRVFPTYWLVGDYNFRPDILFVFIPHDST